MACTYCFYNDEGENRTTKSYGMMSTSTAHALIDKALHDESDSASFGFQGGEPTLAGLDFLSDFVSYARSKADLVRKIEGRGPPHPLLAADQRVCNRPAMGRTVS